MIPPHTSEQHASEQERHHRAGREEDETGEPKALEREAAVPAFAHEKDHPQ